MADLDPAQRGPQIREREVPIASRRRLVVGLHGPVTLQIKMVATRESARVGTTLQQPRPERNGPGHQQLFAAEQ